MSYANKKNIKKILKFHIIKEQELIMLLFLMTFCFSLISFTKVWFFIVLVLALCRMLWISTERRVFLLQYFSSYEINMAQIFIICSTLLFTYIIQVVVNMIINFSRFEHILDFSIKFLLLNICMISIMLFDAMLRERDRELYEDENGNMKVKQKGSLVIAVIWLLSMLINELFRYFKRPLLSYNRTVCLYIMPFILAIVVFILYNYNKYMIFVDENSN